MKPRGHPCNPMEHIPLFARRFYIYKVSGAWYGACYRERDHMLWYHIKEVVNDRLWQQVSLFCATWGDLVDPLQLLVEFLLLPLEFRRLSLGDWTSSGDEPSVNGGKRYLLNRHLRPLILTTVLGRQVFKYARPSKLLASVWQLKKYRFCHFQITFISPILLYCRTWVIPERTGIAIWSLNEC